MALRENPGKEVASLQMGQGVEAGVEGGLDWRVPGNRGEPRGGMWWNTACLEVSSLPKGSKALPPLSGRFPTAHGNMRLGFQISSVL